VGTHHLDDAITSIIPYQIRQPSKYSRPEATSKT